MNILLVHPEGNLNYNANLIGLLELLGEVGHHVTYVAPRRPRINQESNSPWMTVVLLDRHQVRGRFLLPGTRRPDDGEASADFGPWAGHDLVLAVDRGIIDGAWIARHYGIPHAFLSYEIFFRNEMDAELKAEEIEACRDVLFAVSSDGLRARKLCLENGIAPDKMLQIPVAGRGFRPPTPKPRHLHHMFELPAHARTVLYAGSLADWTDASYLLQSTRSWPENWVLIIHERFGPTPENVALIREHGHPERIRVSEAIFGNPNEMSAFIQSADLGLALYCPTYENEWVGRNIEYIGLASGKIASYLQHGVPVATHELGEISDWIRFYGAGQVFSLERPFIPEEPAAGSVKACRMLFEHHLDLNRFGGSLLRAVAGGRVYDQGDCAMDAGSDLSQNPAS